MEERRIRPEALEEAQTERAVDYSWPVIGANWFLLILIVGVAKGAGTVPELLGLVVGYTVGAAVPVCLVFLAVRDKKAFRWKRALTIAAWCVLPIWLYGTIPTGH
jgi:uncharacterized membrane protein